MAITLTEIGGNNSQFKVDGIPDFITEKTAAQLVKVLNQLGGSGSTSKGTTSTINNTGKGKGTFEDVKRTANEFANNLKNENKERKGIIDNLRIERGAQIDAHKRRVSLARSFTSLSSALGTAGFVLLRTAANYAGEAMMKYVGTIEASIQAGTGFALSVNNFGNTLATRATGMGMSFDELAGVLNAFSGVTVLGAGKFTDLIGSAVSFDSELIKLGFSAAEAAELVGRETQFRVNQIGVIDVGSKTIRDSLLDASSRAVKFSQVLGMSTNEFIALRHSAVSQGEAMVGLARGTEEFRAKQLDTVERFADEFIKVGGEAGAQIAAAFIDGATKGALGFSDAAVGIVRALPGMNREFQNLRMGLLTGELNEAEMQKRLNDLLGNQSEATRQRLFILARAGDESAAKLIEFGNNFKKAQTSITLFGITAEKLAEEQIKNFSQFRRGVDAVRNAFGNFLINLFSSEKAIDGMNKAIMNVINALIPGSVTVDGFSKSLKVNAEKIKVAAEEFGAKFGNMAIRMSEYIERFISSLRTTEQNEAAERAKTARQSINESKKEIEAKRAYLQQNNYISKDQIAAVQQQIAEEENNIAQQQKILDKASDIPGIFDAIGNTLVKFSDTLSSIVDNLEIILGALAVMVAAPLIGGVYRGFRAVGNSVRSPAVGRVKASGTMDKRTNAYRNLNRGQQALGNTRAGTTALNFMSNNPAGKAISAGSRFLGPASMGFAGFELGTDLYQGLQDGTKKSGAELIDTYTNRSEGIGGTVGAAIGALGFFLGPVGFVTTSVGQMIGDKIGNIAAMTVEQIEELRSDGSNINQYKQVLTDKFIVPFGAGVDAAVSTSSEKFANILLESMSAEDKYLDTQLSILEEDLSRATSKTGRKRIEKDIEKIKNRQAEKIKNSADALGIDMDATYEEGSDKFIQQQALLNAQNTNNVDQDLRTAILQEQQANYLRQILGYLRDM